MLDQQRTILIVDGSPRLRHIMRHIIRHTGYDTIVEAGDEHTAVLRLQQEAIDFVIVDEHILQAPGLELLTAIRANAELHDTLILLLTTDTRKDRILEAMQAGIGRVVVKPFSANTLEEGIKALAAKALH